MFVNVPEDLSGPLAIQCVWFVEANVLPSIFFPQHSGCDQITQQTKKKKRGTAHSNVVFKMDANASVCSVAAYSPAARQEKAWVGSEEEPSVPPGGTGPGLGSAP